MNQLLSSMRPASCGLGALLLLSSCDQETRDGLLRHTGDYVSDLLHEVLPSDPSNRAPSTRPQGGGSSEVYVPENLDPFRPGYQDEADYPDEGVPEYTDDQTYDKDWGKTLYEKAQSLLQPSLSGPASHETEIIRLLKQSAKAGYTKAQTDLAALYLEGGKGIPMNKKRAYAWFKRAAEQGDQAARCYLAELLYRGEGVARDQKAAIAEWRKAADAGLGEAQYRLSQILTRSSKTRREGMNYLRRAANAGVMGAARDLAYVNAKGVLGMAPNMKQAAYWYNIAANAGDAESLYISAIFLVEGKVVKRNEEKAIRYLKLAAGQDHIDAIKLLINMLNKQNTQPDKREARAWQERLKQLGGTN